MNANDLLRDEFSFGSEDVYQYQTLTVTEGVLALANRYECFWFLDVIWSHQLYLKHEEFQTWTLKRTDDTAVVIATDGNSKELARQEIPYTDFKPTEATVWLEYGTMMLPCER